ncbi:Ubiquinol-cytochrome c reductase subunit 8 [Ceratobasidium theobromae]|uniref:Cytochrome b-c1 complex subunit 8 n=1 Tax=Ceratobasidium theobromae TaxID=1582974 RepID=A0A5N5QNL1_9AGAM|nr:Ubiquinol-cytochrome c reductase subunit 8 [Ceratobasidium theobromae]
MRPTNAVLSTMPTGKAFMGWWGDLGGPKQKGVVQYALSPFKQRALAGALHGYLFNGYARIAAQAPYFAIPFGGGMSSALNFDMIQMIPDASSGVIAYAVYVWANKRDAFLNSKAGHGHGDH